MNVNCISTITQDEAYFRKIKCLSPFQREEWMMRRKILRDGCILREQERQRLRARSTYAQLFQLRLLSEEPDIYDLHEAHAAMIGAFGECR